MAAQTEYLNQIQSYDDSVVDRVKAPARRSHAPRSPSWPTTAAEIKDARDAIAAKEREVAAARAEAEARFAELKSAQAERREAMEALEVARRSAQQQPRLDLRTRSPPKAAPAPDRRGAGAADPRRDRRLHQRKRSQRPGAAPAGGQGRDRRRQLDRHHPLHLGRRPRLLRILRLRLLRRGQLRPARRRLPRKPARLDRPRDLGRTGPGQVDHRLRQRRPRLDDRSPASPSTPSAAPARAGTTPGSTPPKASSPATPPGSSCAAFPSLAL